MKYARQRPSGPRQRIWDVLRRAQKPLSRQEIARRASADLNQTSSFLSLGKRAGYFDAANMEWRLIKNTGPVAPLISGSGHVRDLNEFPPMSGIELNSIIKNSGFSVAGFAEKYGLGRGMTTRIRQMINGQRPVGLSVEEAALAAQKDSQQGK